MQNIVNYDLPPVFPIRADIQTTKQSQNQTLTQVENSTDIFSFAFKEKNYI